MSPKLIASALVLSLVAGVTADTITVCWDGSGDYLTIQDGIDAAVHGDEVVICDGTYTGPGNTNLDVRGKAIRVRSASREPTACIVDCQDAARGFYFQSGEAATVVVDGLKVTNGYASRGGGIYCEYSGPTVNNCIITGNRATEEGGGVYCAFSSALTITNCTISGNSASYGAGGVFCYDFSNLTIGNSTIGGNSTTGRGGGVACFDYSSLTITNCTISGNSATNGAGGILCWYDFNSTLTNSTVAGNTAGGHGGGILCDESSPTITNCILWGNSPEQVFVTLGDPVVTYSDAQGGWSGIGNIDSDPLFADPDGADNDPDTWEDNDYHVTVDSPCIDAGDPAFEPGPDERDIDGQMRVWDGDEDGVWRVDMGSDEFGSMVPGDLNADGCVGQPDLGILLAHWGVDDGGDLDFDGDTDQSDLGILLAHWGEGCE